LAAWRNVLVEPPVHADAVAEWLEKHPTASPEVHQAAWQALAHVGTAKPEAVTRLASQLATEKIDPALKPLLVKSLERHVVAGAPGEVDKVLASVRGR
jgi:hypothetical protein